MSMPATVVSVVSHLFHAVHGHDGLDDLSGHTVGFLFGQAVVGGEGDGGLIAGNFGQKDDAHGEDLPAAEGQQHDCSHQRQSAVLQHHSRLWAYLSWIFSNQTRRFGSAFSGQWKQRQARR